MTRAEIREQDLQNARVSVRHVIEAWVGRVKNLGAMEVGFESMDAQFEADLFDPVFNDIPVLYLGH